ncbi:MAG: L-serine ammonia-lyase, iron-sulfur-dependent, subunit alpha [Puniceicoccales bacterium]|jgi:L-serine dehydratase|nr:L-serine ammonia-lyase, iron-sulfur-dependent, subunit alpha [Puniceicoccales bacterium]
MSQEKIPSYDYDTAVELLALCKQTGLDIAGIALARECAERACPATTPLEKMLEHYRVMRASIRKGLEIQNLSPSKLSGGDAAKLYAYAQTAAPLLGADFARTIAYGFAVLEVNAQFGRIVATPTAGSAGIVPACLAILEETRGISEERCARALFTAAGIGIIIGKNACFSGAQGGCQAEVGSASCIAAAAITEACGGTPEQACNAGAFALMNTLGLVCDPIGGYVEVPCVSRNGMFAVHSFLAATMALAGARCVVPLDDVIIAMRDIGRRMPRSLKETALAGLAQTPSGLQFPPQGFDAKQQ